MALRGWSPWKKKMAVPCSGTAAGREIETPVRRPGAQKRNSPPSTPWSRKSITVALDVRSAFHERQPLAQELSSRASCNLGRPWEPPELRSTTQRRSRPTMWPPRHSCGSSGHTRSKRDRFRSASTKSVARCVPPPPASSSRPTPSASNRIWAHSTAEQTLRKRRAPGTWGRKAPATGSKGGTSRTTAPASQHVGPSGRSCRWRPRTKGECSSRSASRQ
mmetsp:Transcript_7333/g.22366  ORF Transcript_7333/g.22366 Transcript_7333/m.22366 type:complete len:219 (+) Transcript_7333:661-1317(+)